MAAITTALTLAATAVGAGLQYMGTQKQTKAIKAQTAEQNKAAEAQQQAENARRQQMELDAARRKRQQIREAIQARSFALATTTAQGAAAPGSSALPGAYGAISGQTGVNMLGVDQNLELGRNIYDANASASSSYRQAALYGTQASEGAGLASLGGVVIQSAGSIGRVGGYLAGQVGSVGGFGSGVEPLTGRRVGGGV